MSALQFVKHKDINFKKWDQVILSSALPLVFAQSFYLNATCPDWGALVVGDYESVFPITAKKKLGYEYFPQPPFTSQLGVFGKVNPEVEKIFLEYILQNYSLIEIELNATNKIQSEFITPKNTFLYAYSNGANKQNQNTKRNIARAKEAELKVVQVHKNEIFSLSSSCLDPFLSDTLHLSKIEVQIFNDLIKSADKQNYLYTFKVTNQENAIKALGHFICNGKHALFLKGTNFDRSDNSGSMHLLMQYAIEFFSDKASFFDFGGGSNSKGLADFYKGFGGEIMEYSFLRVNKLPWLIKLIKNKK